MTLYIKRLNGQMLTVLSSDLTSGEMSTSEAHYASYLNASEAILPTERWLIYNQISSYFGVESDLFLSIKVPLLGGKGGFGSLLKKQKKANVTNTDDCRDADGTRLRNVREQARIEAWKREKAKEEKNKKPEKEKLDTIEIKAKVMLDQSYYDKLEEEREKVKAATSSNIKKLIKSANDGSSDNNINGGNITDVAKLPSKGLVNFGNHQEELSLSLSDSEE